MEQTGAVLLGLYLKCSPGHDCLTWGFSRLRKAFFQAPAPSQHSPIRVRNCGCHRLKSRRLKRGIFLPKLSPPFRWEPARSLTQVASFPLNTGVPCDECV